MKNHPEFQLLKILVNIISVLTKSNKGYLSENCNEAGAWLTGCLPNKLEGMIDSKHTGLNVSESIKENLDTYILYNLELIDFYNNSELKSSLENAEFVLGIQSYITEEEMNYYDVILPLATVFESPGTFINIENEWQSFVQCCSPHYMSKEGWKILTKLRLVHGSEIGETLDYIDILNEIDSIIRNNKKILDESKKKLSIDKIKKEDFLIRCGGDSSYFTDSVVRRATSLNKVNINKNLVRVNKKTLEQNNIDLSKNKIIIKQGKNKLLVDLVIDENVSNDCVYIINSNKEHYDLGKQYQPIMIENV